MHNAITSVANQVITDKGTIRVVFPDCARPDPEPRFTPKPNVMHLFTLCIKMLRILLLTQD